jgi:hypothetical protein
MKARKVKSLDPAGPLGGNARRIVSTRADELWSFDPNGDAQTLHDMRIAAKRLRYVLELTSPVLGREAARGAREAKAIQTLLGEIHDCDEMLSLVERHTARLREEDAGAALSRAPAKAADLPPNVARSLPNRTRYRGLETLGAHLRARRSLLHQRFVEKWEQLERKGFRERLEAGAGR